MDLKLSKVKLIFNYYEATSNKVALAFDQISMDILSCKLNPTDATIECHQNIFKWDSLKVSKLLFRLSLRTANLFATSITRSLSVLFLCVFYLKVLSNY